MAKSETSKVNCDPESHYAQIEFFGECSWCNEVQEGLLEAKS